MMASDTFTKMLEESMPHLRGYAYSLVRNRDAAEDLVQDTLLRAWASRSRFVQGTNFKAWTFTILRNRFLDQRRRDRFSDTPIDNTVHANLVSAPPQDVVIYFDEMASAYWRLSPHHRQILMLVGAMGLGYEEAAQVTGCAVGTVRSRLSRARTKLRSTLDAGDNRKQPGHRGAAEFLRALAAA